VSDKSVLVAEDFDDTRTMIRMLLEMKGYHVLEAVNGREAVEATRRIREQSRPCRVPIVAMSAHCEGAGRRRRWRPGPSTASASPSTFRSSKRYSAATPFSDPVFKPGDWVGEVRRVDTEIRKGGKR